MKSSDCIIHFYSFHLFLLKQVTFKNIKLQNATEYTVFHSNFKMYSFSGVFVHTCLFISSEKLNILIRQCSQAFRHKMWPRTINLLRKMVLGCHVTNHSPLWTGYCEKYHTRFSQKGSFFIIKSSAGICSLLLNGIQMEKQNCVSHTDEKNTELKCIDVQIANPNATERIVTVGEIGREHV